MRILVWLWIILLAIACKNFPKDPEKTLENVKDGILKVGYSENPPWVIKTDTAPTGIEAELLKEFARQQNARIEWQNDSEQDLFEMLEKKELHVIISGLTDKNSWKKKISFTKPYLQLEKDKRVMAVLKGENAFIMELEKFLHEQKTKLEAATL